jgi:predicted nucleic acid-binding protein
VKRARTVLVDTGAWLAAFHRRDQYHFQAAAELRRLREARTQLIVTDLILAETHLHLLYALGPTRAVEYLETLKADPAIEEVHASSPLQTAAISQWMRRFSDQAFTLTDAISFAVMRDRGTDVAFTFDQHFRVAGFRILPQG